MRRYLLSVVLSLSVLLSALVAAQDASYTFTTIDVPDATSTQAYGINNRGQIVGWFNYATGRAHGFLKDGPTFTTIDVLPSARFTEAYGINNKGQIVGRFSETLMTPLAGFVKNGATFGRITVPGLGTITTALGINDMGQIVGYFTGSPVIRKDAGFLTTDGMTFTIIAVPGAIFTEARGINNMGQIVGVYTDATGRYGFLTTDGTTFTIIAVPGATSTEARGINDTGQIVGVYADATGGHSFLKDGATFTTLDVPGSARGINTAGQIVGTFGDATGSHGFVATPVDKILPIIIVSASPETLWPPNGKLVTVAVSGTITDSGGSGMKAGSAAYVVLDEYGQIQPRGNLTLGADGSYAFTVELTASRNGNDPDGRHYTIAVSANDNAGNLGVMSALVTVPHG